MTSLNSLFSLGFTSEDPDIRDGLNWFIETRQPDSLWKIESGRPVIAKEKEERLWLGLNICLMLKKYSNPLLNRILFR